jgi:hypothetical protein
LEWPEKLAAWLWENVPDAVEKIIDDHLDEQVIEWFNGAFESPEIDELKDLGDITISVERIEKGSLATPAEKFDYGARLRRLAAIAGMHEDSLRRELRPLINASIALAMRKLKSEVSQDKRALRACRECGGDGAVADPSILALKDMQLKAMRAGDEKAELWAVTEIKRMMEQENLREEYDCWECGGSGRVRETEQEKALRLIDMRMNAARSKAEAAV